MGKLFAVALGILTAIGGFLDIGDLVTNAVVGSRFPSSAAYTAPIRRRSSRSSTRSSPLADYQRECTADRKWRS